MGKCSDLFIKQNRSIKSKSALKTIETIKKEKTNLESKWKDLRVGLHKQSRKMVTVLGLKPPIQFN